MLKHFFNTIRILARSPGYTLTCIAVLALGIGANAAIFSVVYSVILKPLPYPDVSRLVFVWERYPNMPMPLGARMEAAYRNYLEWKRQNTVFSDMAAMRKDRLDETGIDHPRHVDIAYTSPGMFQMLGVHPRLGRLFEPAEDRKGSDQVAVISDRYFDRRFHRDPRAVGQTIQLAGADYTVIGVLPASFHLPSTWEGQDQWKPEVWLPNSRFLNRAEDEMRREFQVIARLKPGVSVAQARTEMTGIARRLQESDKKLDEAWLTAVYPFDVEDTSPALHRALLVLLGAVAFLLLIACANLANLTLARATLRSREIAVRLALGATPGRIIAQLISESLVVSIAGALAGLLLAYWCVKAMLALATSDTIQRPENIGINLAVFGFAAAAGLVTTLLIGLAPAIASSRADLNSALKAGGWGTSAARLRSRQFLIAAEVALALMLVCGAGLMIRSFQELIATGLGYRTSQVLTADVDLPEKTYSDGAAQSRFFRGALERVRALPGVTSACAIDNLPLHRVSLVNFYIAGRPKPSADALPIADYAHLDAACFPLMGVRLEAGRLFTESDRAITEKGPDGVAVVNRAFARQFFAGENPLGKRILDAGEKHAFEIVGIVSDYRPMGVENGVRPEIFYPSLQLRSATILAGTRGRPGSFSKAIQNTIWSIDKDIPASQIKPWNDYVDEWQAPRKFNTLLMGILAGLALVLAMMGIYGVLSNLVASRIREIGIRMAIGASPAGIGKLILRQSLLPLAVGLAIGVAGALVLSRFLTTLLYNVAPRDPWTLGLSAAAILLVSPAALYVPLRRATSVDCTVALREE